MFLMVSFSFLQKILTRVRTKFTQDYCVHCTRLKGRYLNMVIFIMKKIKVRYILVSILEIRKISEEVSDSSWDTDVCLFKNLMQDLIKFWDLHICF